MRANATRNQQAPKARILAVMLFAALSMPVATAQAAHKCTKAEIREFTSLLQSSNAASRRCDKALGPSSKLSVRQTCAACNGYFNYSRRVQSWLKKHANCAADIHAGPLTRALLGYQKAHRNLCS